MSKEYRQRIWDRELEHCWREIVRIAVREDIQREHDWTTLALISAELQTQAAVVARRAGVIAGLPAAETAVDEMRCSLTWTSLVEDGTQVQAGAEIARLEGAARDLLTAERLLLNAVGRLSGIATATRQYVDAVRHTRARIYDTRKTTPGWRGLEKYAVRCGGGINHRSGLHEAILIKDNHLALARHLHGDGFSSSDAVEQARRFLRDALPADRAEQMIVEVEVDTLEQFDRLLSAQPDVVLLDNMQPDRLHEAVRRRDHAQPRIVLEASGGIDLSTVAAVAESGVDRISVGAITHSAACLDVGMDWREG